MNNVSSLYGRHNGGRCFILGNGPSLNGTDVKLLKNEITFGVNSIFLMTATNGFRPTYYVVEDNLVFSENLSAIDSFAGVQKILPAQYAAKLSKNDDVYVFDMDTSFYNRNIPERYATPQFNSSQQARFFCGQSVTYINMQLAFYMGFSEVFLLGMDFSYSKPQTHEQAGNHIHSHGDDPNHFHKDYFGAGKTWKDPRLGRVLRSYMRAKFEFESSGRKIFNATPGGELELFPRVSFESLVQS